MNDLQFDIQRFNEIVVYEKYVSSGGWCCSYEDFLNYGFVKDDGSGSIFVKDGSIIANFNPITTVTVYREYYGENLEYYYWWAEENVEFFADGKTLVGLPSETIKNSGDNVKIYGNGVKIENYSAYNVLINTYNGNDTIFNDYGTNATINTGNGNDSVSNSGWHVTINTGNGSDTVSNSGGYVSINSSTDNVADSIHNSGEYVTVVCGVGNDSVIEDGEYSVIDLGAGNDCISLRGQYEDRGTTVYSGTGNDYIDCNYSRNGTIYIGEKTGNYETLDLNEIDNPFGYSMFFVNVESGNNEIIIDDMHNYGYEWQIKTPQNNVSIRPSNYGMEILNTGSGDDTIYNVNSNWMNCINAGSGNNHIENSQWNVTIKSGDGDDFIKNEGFRVDPLGNTITGGQPFQ